MPHRPMTPCNHGRCPNLCVYGHAYCSEHEPLHPKRKASSYEANRPNAAKRGYTSKGQRARKAWLHSHPLCERCKARGLYIEADVVDHIIPHKGNYKLFGDRDNWQALCKHCHDVKTATEDRNKTNKVYEYDFKKKS